MQLHARPRTCGVAAAGGAAPAMKIVARGWLCGQRGAWLRPAEVDCSRKAVGAAEFVCHCFGRPLLSTVNTNHADANRPN
jgi:hypothetical protein